MKYFLPLFIAVIFSFSYCTKQSSLFLNKHPEQIIALQPLDSFSRQETDSIIQSLHRFFNKTVILLQPIVIPHNYFNGVIQQYNADSILLLLSKMPNDTLVEIAGITHQPLFTIKEAQPVAYFDQHIFGLGYQPGNTCVVSDFKFKTADTMVYNRRMANVLLHEIGHNIGLSHCPDDKCIMSKNNGDIMTLDNCGNDYCSSCRKKLQ